MRYNMISKAPAIFVIAMLLMLCHAQAQNTTTQKPNIKLPAYNILNRSEYTISAEVIDLYVSRYTLMKNNDKDKKQEFTLSPNTLESFVKNFQEKFLALAKEDEAVKTEAKAKDLSSTDTNIVVEARKLFFFFMASERAIESVESAPLAGRLCFNRNVEIERELLEGNQLFKLSKRTQKTVGKWNPTLLFRSKITVDSLGKDDFRKNVIGKPTADSLAKTCC
jgi:hypothetical protein